MKQSTIANEASIQGKSLHTGEEVTLTVKPAEADAGFIFRRTDLYGKPEIKPLVANVTDLVRSTTISSGHAQIHTVEHILSALQGCGIDNAIIEMDASEPPILDGSSRDFVKMIQEAGIKDLEKERVFFELKEPVSVSEGNRSIIALPHDGLRITCTSADDRGIHTQHLSIDLSSEVYMKQIANARTFTIYEDIEELLKLGKIQGGSLDSAVVIKGDKIISKEPLRFKDEFVRHKILDIIGDIALLGCPLKAHIVAVRPGHALNSRLTARLAEIKAKPAKKSSSQKVDKAIIQSHETALDVRRILDTLPHRYPFVLVDRVNELDDEKIVAIKNVSINEPFFMGHFPGRPVMPGVLQLEAMAQAAGIILIRKRQSASQIAFFMSADKVKFRRAVVPGDQLEIRAELTKTRGTKLAQAKAQCYVDGKVVSSADLMFSIIDSEENG